jgi:heptosyltransferase-2
MNQSISRVVIAPNWIGDSVMAIPFVRALRRSHPGDRLAVLARRGPAAVFRAEGSVDQILARSGFLADVALLRRERFEEAWLLPNSLRAALLGWSAGIGQRIGYATDHRASLLTLALPPPSGVRHQLRDYDDLLTARGIALDLEAPRLPISDEGATRAGRALAAAGLESGRPLALLAPGAAFGWTKRWPAERFSALSDRLAASGYSVGLVIGPGEEELGVSIASRAKASPPVLGQDLDPAELAALLARARVVVANDSGAMHLAAAVGTPVVAFFGPTDPGRTAPAGSPAKILDRYVFCSPCFLKECPYGHECLREIGVEDVMRAVEELARGEKICDL